MLHSLQKMIIFGSIRTMKELLLLCSLMTAGFHFTEASESTDLSFELKPTLSEPNPLSEIVELVPLIKVISTGTLPHASSVHYLNAELISDDLKIPIQFEWQRNMAISDTVLLQPNLKAFRSSILSFFTKESELEADVEWIRAPNYDYHANQFNFSMKVKFSDKNQQFYGKSIYLLQDGYLSFQILAPYQDNLSGYLNQWASELKIKKNLDYHKSSNPRVRDMRDLLKRWSLPFGVNPQNAAEDAVDTSVNSDTRRTAGITFLLFSILFFILITPGTKKS